MADDLSPAELRRRLATRSAELSAAHARLDELANVAKTSRELRHRLERARAEQERLARSPEYRLGKALLKPWRKLAEGLGGQAKRRLPAWKKPPMPARPALTYHQWRAQEQLTEADLIGLRAQVAAFPRGPLVSIAFPVFNTPLDRLEQAVASVRAQVYEHWELLATDDASTDPRVLARLQAFAADDPRVKVEALSENRGIALASNAAIDRAQGELVAFLDHDDFLEPDALCEIVRAWLAEPEADMVYSDEDKVDAAGYFQRPFFKPDWAPDALLSSNYLCHFTAVRRALLAQLGGFRAGFDGAQDYDLFLRATERARRIVHVPKVLYHWRISAESTAGNSAQKPAAADAGSRALTEALSRRGLDAVVEPGAGGTRHRVRYGLRVARKISIIIPTKDRVDLLATCLESLAAHTDYPDYEIVIVDNGSVHPETARYLRRQPHRVLHFGGPFNFAALANYGARASDGDWLLFLNNDIEAIEPGWLGAMAEHVQRPEIGAVGAQLIFPNGTVQHAGVLLSTDDIATHAYFGELAGSFENGGFLQMIRNYSAVTAACLLARREVVEECGGFDETGFAVSFNDLDLCLKMRARGYRILYTPHARLIHRESASRGGARSNPLEARLMRERWAAELARDPFNNPRWEAWRKSATPAR